MDLEIISANEIDVRRISDLCTSVVRQSSRDDYKPWQIDLICSAYTPEKVEKYVEQCSVFCGFLGTEMVGCSMLRDRFIIGLFVEKPLQGKGYGKALLQRAFVEARKSSKEVVLVYTSVTAAGFYRKMGFGFVFVSKSAGYDMRLHAISLNPDKKFVRFSPVKLALSVVIDRSFFLYRKMKAKIKGTDY